MSDRKLESLTFEQIPNVRYVLDADKIGYDESETYEEGSVGEALQHKAEVDGYYSDLTAGDAEQLISTMAVEDSVPYKYRTTGGSADVGNREYMNAIVGGTVAWNQLVHNGNFAEGNAYWGIAGALGDTYANNSVTLTCNDGTVASSFSHSNALMSDGHIHLFMEEVNPSKATTRFRFITGTGDGIVSIQANVWNSVFRIWRQSGTTAGRLFPAYFNAGVLETDDTVALRNVRMFDLTQMFGSTIADYIYSLEQSQTGAGVAFFKSLFPNDYYEYDAGTLKSVEGLSSHDMVGFNQWDEETVLGYFNPNGGWEASTSNLSSKNPIPVLPNTAYYCHCGTAGAYVYATFWKEEVPSGASATEQIISRTSNIANAVFVTPSNCKAIHFNTAVYGTTYNNDICINLSWIGWRNGEYEPYVKHSYPLDSSLTLRGIPKLDASNNLYYDGDEYASDGTVTRKWGYAVIDGSEGTITSPNTNQFNIDGIISNAKYAVSTITYMSNKYMPVNQTASNSSFINVVGDKNKVFGTSSSSQTIRVLDKSYSTVDAFKTALALNPLMVVYELAAPTTETAEPYQRIQLCDDFGTEEFVSTGIVPVGHNTEYPSNLRDKLQHLPDLADNDGAYLIQQTNKQMSLVLFRIPKAPTTDGTYVLKATVSGGTPTYTWVDETAESEATE